ncbi:MAG: hypothetical protein CMF87_03900 [Candidatus Marinimicrobia bacterium]|nr:hypothetical protein [Candidatus Neomarinimicrobiota bacterium]
MKNKILLFVFIITFSSCSIFQKTQTVSQNVETSSSEPEDSLQKFVGNYDIAVFGLPDGSDLIVAMNVSKNGDGLTTVFTSDEANQGFEILRTEVEDDILYIDIYVKDYGINTAFEIYVEGNQVTGYLADMFELEGVKSD